MTREARDVRDLAPEQQCEGLRIFLEEECRRVAGRYRGSARRVCQPRGSGTIGPVVYFAKVREHALVRDTEALEREERVVLLEIGPHD